MASFPLRLAFPLGGDLNTGPLDNIVIYPSSATAGDVLKLSAAGTDLLNTYDDDLFASGAFTPARWSNVTTGSVTTSSFRGAMKVAVDTVLSSSEYRLTSTALFNGIDCRFAFEILHNTTVDTTTGSAEIVYGKLAVYGSAGTGVYVSIERIRTGAGLQAVRTTITNGVSTVVSAIIPDISTVCDLRILRSTSGHAIIMYNGVQLASILLAADVTLVAAIGTKAINCKSRLSVLYKSFISRIGLLVGGLPVVDATHVSKDRLEFVMPPTNAGVHAATLYGKNGIISYSVNVVTAEVGQGQAISSADGMVATIRNDTVLR